jgi:PAS domain S-box-containing protein
MGKRQRPVLSSSLRRRKEERLARKSTDITVPLNPVNRRRVIRELQAARIELEKKDQELMRARSELNASQEMFRDLYDFAPVVYLSLNRGGAICRINSSGAGFLGMERILLINRRFASFVADEDRPIFDALLAGIFESKEKAACEVTLLNVEGSQIIVMIEAVLSKDEKECHVVLEDITERKKMEVALRKSERKYRTIFENTGTPMVIADENTIIHEINSEFEHLFGYSRNELVGCSWEKLVLKEDLERLMGYHEQRSIDPEAGPRNY